MLLGQGELRVWTEKNISKEILNLLKMKRVVKKYIRSRQYKCTGYIAVLEGKKEEQESDNDTDGWMSGSLLGRVSR